MIWLTQARGCVRVETVGYDGCGEGLGKAEEGWQPVKKTGWQPPGTIVFVSTAVARKVRLQVGQDKKWISPDF